MICARTGVSSPSYNKCKGSTQASQSIKLRQRFLLRLAKQVRWSLVQ